MTPARWSFAGALALAFAGTALAAATRLHSPGEMYLRWAEAGAGSYLDIAENFAGGGVLDNGRPPAYPFLISILPRFLPASVAWPAVVLAHVAACVALAMGAWWAAWRGTERPWLAVGTAGAVALNLALLREVVVARETGLMALVLLAMFLAWQSLARNPQPWLVHVVGFLGAACWLVRPTGLFVLLAGALLLAWELRAAPRRWVLAGAWLAGLWPVGAWVAYQVANGQQVHVSGRSSATTLYYGSHPSLATIYPLIDVDNLDAIVEAEVRAASPADRDAWFRARFAARWREAPGEMLALSARKAAVFFVPIQFPLGDGRPVALGGGRFAIEEYRLLSLAGLVLGVAALPGVLLFFAMVLGWRDLDGTCRAVVLWVAAIAAIHVATFAETRYRQPLDPVLAAAGACFVGGRRRAG